MLTKEECAEIRALCEAATPGPWRVDKELPDCYIRHEGIGWPIACMWNTANGRWEDDAKFIAESRTLIPKLLDALEEVEADRDKWKKGTEILLDRSINIQETLEEIIRKFEKQGLLETYGPGPVGEPGDPGVMPDGWQEEKE